MSFWIIDVMVIDPIVEASAMLHEAASSKWTPVGVGGHVLDLGAGN